MAAKFQPANRYDVYDDLTSEARFLRLHHDSSINLDSALGMFSDARAIARWHSSFNSLSTISLILMTLRLLDVLDFQPRMGLVTRTIFVALEDLGHFAVLFSLIFMAFAFIAFVNFGESVRGLSEISLALESLFYVLLGDVTVYEDMKGTPNSAAGMLFFYAFLIIVFFVLLNILLAIIVDSYADVKEQVGAADTMPEEVMKLVRALSRSGNDKRILAELATLSSKVKNTSTKRQKDPQGGHVLDLPDFHLTDHAINEVVVRLSNKITTTEEQQDAKRLLLAVVARFGSTQSADGESKSGDTAADKKVTFGNQVLPLKPDTRNSLSVGEMTT